VLNPEVIHTIGCQSQLFLAPPSWPVLLKHGVAQHDHVLGARVVETLGFAARLIADEHHWSAPILKIGGFLVSLFHMGNTTESVQVLNTRLGVVPYLVWRLSVEALDRRVIKNVDRSHNCLPPQNQPVISITLSML
jgi:hypothetical protein